jgi:hypothetical protein
LKTNKDDRGRPLYDDALNERVNSIPQSSSHLTQLKDQNGQALQYKMLKCDSKLVRFIFELNGLI